jgi:hypothetical protein
MSKGNDFDAVEHIADFADFAVAFRVSVRNS